MNSTIFTPAKVGRASEDVALQIEAAILDGKIRTGERLPSERELQVHFRTGRGVIREALHALRQKGLVEVKKGAKGGAFVRRLNAADVSDSLALFLKQNRIDPEQLIEFRESLDRTITVLAIARSNSDQKTRLLEDTGKLEEALSRPEPDWPEVWEMDRRLNIRLAKMTRNPIFEVIMRAIQLGLSSYDHILYEDPEYRNRTAGNWKHTAQHIAEGEPQKALAYISYHYLMLRRCLGEKNIETHRETQELWVKSASGAPPNRGDPQDRRNRDRRRHPV